MDLKKYTPRMPAMPANTVHLQKTALLNAIQQDISPTTLSPRRARVRARRLTLPARLTIAGSALAAAATVAAVFVTGLGPATAPAYASWTPTPAAANPATLATLTAACQQRLARQTPTGAVTPDRVVLAERRGDFTAIILDNPQHQNSHGTCLQTPGDLIAGTGGPPRRWPSSQITLIFGPTVLRQQEGMTSMLGRVPPAVADVTITTFGGQRITATVTNNWFFAWWPITSDNHETSGPRILTTTAADGTELETINAQGPPFEPTPPPLQPSTTKN